LSAEYKIAYAKRGRAEGALHVRRDMNKFNRILYAISIASTSSCALISLIAIWLEINNKLLWKTTGSLFVISVTSLFILAINYHMKKLSDNRKSKED
jgi:hypothetical protein